MPEPVPGLHRDNWPRCTTCREPLSIYGGWWQTDNDQRVALSVPVWRCPNDHKPQSHALPPKVRYSDEAKR